MNTHWTERSTKDFLFRIAADFISQLEDKLESTSITKNELAKKLGVSKGRVSQIFNNPGNLTLQKIIEYSRALGMKVSLVAYEDNDPNNIHGPINSDIFRICWTRAGKPREFWDLQKVKDEYKQMVNLAIPDRSFYTGTEPTEKTSSPVSQIKDYIPANTITPLQAEAS